MTLPEFLDAIRLRWKIFLTAFLGCVGLGVILGLVQPTGYVSTVRLLVSAQGTTTATSYENLQVESGRADTYVALLTSEVVAQRVVDDLGLAKSARELSTGVNATIVPQTTVIDVEVTGDSPEQARLLADTLAREFVEYSAALETPTGSDDQRVRTTVVSSASPPIRQMPTPVNFGLLGAFAGLVAGATAVWVRSRTDPLVRIPSDAAAASGLPVLGSVPSGGAGSTANTESYRSLRTRLLTAERREGTGGQVWQVTSPDPRCDTAGVVALLGRTLTAGGSRVLIVDADLRGAHLDETYGLGPGLAEVLTGVARVDHVVQRIDNGLLDALSAGIDTDDSIDLLPTSAMAELVDALRADYAFVVIGTPAVAPVSDAAAVSRYTDGVLVVVTEGTTRRRDLNRAVECLHTVGARLMGVVVRTNRKGPRRGKDGAQKSDETSTSTKHRR